MSEDFECCPGNSPFCLGMCEYTCCGTISTAKNASSSLEPKRKKLSLTKDKCKSKAPVLSPSTRFNCIVTDEEATKFSKGVVPKNTSKSTSWAVRVFNEWIEQRNKRAQNQYPNDLLEKEYNCSILCECLKRFVSEARRGDGTPYPPKTLYQILCGLLRYQRSCQRNPPNFLDRKDVRFKELHGTCDFVFQELHAKGLGAAAKVITAEDENILWKSGVLNTKTPDGLQRAMFYYVGKVCCLRGGTKQRNLKPSQFVRQTDPDMYIYTENGSKNRNGGFYQLEVPNKTVSIYKNDSVGERCLVKLLDLYLSKLPKAAFEKGIFYCRSLVKFTEKGPWYSQQPRGFNVLNEMVKTMCTEANIEGRFTNHSLRATGATELFQKEVPEKIIQEVTGHRSVKALRQYERVSNAQKEAACNILTGSESKNFNTEVEKVSTSTSSSIPPDTLGQNLITGKCSSSAFPIPAQVFSPVINSNSSGIINFTINIGSLETQKKSASSYDHLFEGINMEDFVSFP